MPTRPQAFRALGQKTKTERVATYNASPERRATQHLYDHSWRAYSKARLARYPWCVECLKEGKPAGWQSRGHVTDHIRPHKGNALLFMDQNNHQTLCKTHHDRKTATEDGGFGKARK